jgi:hypothetical protein
MIRQACVFKRGQVDVAGFRRIRRDLLSRKIAQPRNIDLLDVPTALRPSHSLSALYRRWLVCEQSTRVGLPAR